MPRKSFTNKINILKEDIKNMGEKVAQRIEDTLIAIRDSDISKAREVSENDNEIDNMEQEIEQFCLTLLALEQPMAKDLRMIAGCLKIITDIERVADQCEDICDILISEEIETDENDIEHICRILKTAKDMFVKVMDVFVSKDVDEAVKVCQLDDKIDEIFSNIIMELAEQIGEKKIDVIKALNIMFIAKYVERMGDHITNIAEWIIYIKTGEHPILN